MGVNGIYGLSGSGLDIESMVKVGMLGKQNEYDKMQQKYTKNEWTKAAYLELSSSITTFNLSTLSQYKYPATMKAKTAESDNSALKVTATASAGVMNHIVSVTSLSSNAYLIGTNHNMTRNNIVSDSETSTKLADVLFTAEEKDDLDKDSDDVAFRFTIKDGNGDDANETTIEYKYSDLLANNKSFSTFISDINNGGTNVRANYDINQDAFSFFNSEGGTKNGIQLTFGTDDAGIRARKFFENMQLVQSRNGTLDNNGTPITFSEGGSTNSFMGTDGEILVDGVKYTTTKNQVTVDGITYTATKEVSNVNVTVSQDVDGIVEKVKSFVADYNKLLSSIYEKYDEKPNSDYKPLTQSQKDGMKDEQIEKWETKAKAGLLYHDNTLRKIINEMRSSVNSQIEGLEGKYNSAYSIGIGTTGIKGQLTLNEDKLRAALADDPDSVYNVFATLDSENTTNSDTNGVAQRLGDILTTATKSIKTRAGSSADITEDSDLNNLLRQLQTRMSNFKKMMSTFEDALYKKYDAMESTLAKLGTQLNYVTGGQ